MLSEPMYSTRDFCDRCAKDTRHTVKFGELKVKQHQVFFYEFCDDCMAEQGENTMVYKMQTSTSKWRTFILKQLSKN